MIGGIVTSVRDNPTSHATLVVEISDRPASAFSRSTRTLDIERNLDTERIQIGDRVWITSTARDRMRGQHVPSSISDCKRQSKFAIVSASETRFITTDAWCRNARKSLSVVGS